MINRFVGPQGKNNLVLALQQQYLVHNDRAIAESLADKVVLHEYHANETIMARDALDIDLHFILSGRAAVRVNNRQIAVRAPGKHIGEMAMIDPCARRSAWVIALEDTITGSINQADFLALANKDTIIWRYIAMELGDRLRQINQDVSQHNEKPVIFLGSSRESLPIVNSLIDCFDLSQVVLLPWTELFLPSAASVEVLENALSRADFGILVFRPDDKVHNTPSEHVIMECGICTGAIGRKRTFFLTMKGADVRIPTDLYGLSPLEYEYDTISNRFNFSQAHSEIMWCIKMFGVK